MVSHRMAPRKRSLKFYLFAALTLALAGVQCSSPQKWTRSGQVLVPQVELNEELTQVTQVGDNHSPRFSPDSQKLVYTSGDRPFHSYSQIYELNLKTQKEQRLTFQGADNQDPQYVRDGKWLLYSSATDETKERPLLSKDANKDNFQGPEKYKKPMEIYLHNLEKFEVIRLTALPGFDGEAFWYDKNEGIIFTRRKNNQLFLYSMNARRPKIVRPYSRIPGNSQWSSSQDVKSHVWIHWSDTYETSELKVKWPSGYVTLLPDFDRIKKDPYYDEELNVIFFSMNHPDPKKFNVFSVHMDGACLTQWTSQGDNVEPTLSPDKTHLAFSSNRSGSYQIYLKDWPKTPPCALFKKDLK